MEKQQGIWGRSRSTTRCQLLCHGRRRRRRRSEPAFRSAAGPCGSKQQNVKAPLSTLNRNRSIGRKRACCILSGAPVQLPAWLSHMRRLLGSCSGWASGGVRTRPINAPTHVDESHLCTTFRNGAEPASTVPSEVMVPARLGCPCGPKHRGVLHAASHCQVSCQEATACWQSLLGTGHRLGRAAMLHVGTEVGCMHGMRTA